MCSSLIDQPQFEQTRFAVVVGIVNEIERERHDRWRGGGEFSQRALEARDLVVENAVPDARPAQAGNFQIAFGRENGEQI